MKEIMTKETVGYAQIKNEVLSDKNMSWKAKGLFSYLYSKPSDWDFSLHRIVLDSSGGKREIMTGLQELEKNGYLRRIRLSNGKMSYHLSYTQNRNEEEKPDCVKSNELKTQHAEIATVSNKELITNIDSITNIEKKLTQKTQKFIEELKETMNGVTIKKEQIEEIKKFISYWTEPDKNWKTQKDPKIRYDHQKTWDTKRRLATWMKNQITFAGGKTQTNNKYQITED